MTDDLRTPEARLLSKRRLGSFYLDDVRALIGRAERKEGRPPGGDFVTRQMLGH